MLLRSRRTTQLSPVGASKVVYAANGAVRFKNVTFAYDNGQTIIDNLTLNIPEGQRIGIVGQSGVGKSTLFNLSPPPTS